jgi:hypothetical protein
MSVLNLEEHRTGKNNATDLMIVGNPPHQLYSLKIQDGDRYLPYKRWYICTQGMGMSIETNADLNPGKWLEHHIEEMLVGELYIESSTYKTFSMSPALRKRIRHPDGYDVIKNNEGIWGLYYLIPFSQELKLIKPFPEGVPMRCLEAILYYSRNGEPMPVPYSGLGKTAQDKLVMALRNTLTLEEWPDNRPYIVVETKTVPVRILMTDCLDILAGEIY